MDLGEIAKVILSKKYQEEILSDEEYPRIGCTRVRFGCKRKIRFCNTDTG